MNALMLLLVCIVIVPPAALCFASLCVAGRCNRAEGFQEDLQP